MKNIQIQSYKDELSLESKKGLDFIVAAGLIWAIIAYIWTLPYTAYNKSVLTFVAGGLLMPLAYLMSKLLKTNWKIKNNPLQALGLYLNFAQLFYFPFIVFFLIEDPNYFVMGYAIITAAHLFPYTWLYDCKGYAIIAMVGSVGSFLLALNVTHSQMYYVPLFITLILAILMVWIYKDLVHAERNKLGKERTP